MCELYTSFGPAPANSLPSTRTRTLTRLHRLFTKGPITELQQYYTLSTTFHSVLFKPYPARAIFVTLCGRGFDGYSHVPMDLIKLQGLDWKASAKWEAVESVGVCWEGLRSDSGFFLGRSDTRSSNRGAGKKISLLQEQWSSRRAIDICCCFNTIFILIIANEIESVRGTFFFNMVVFQFYMLVYLFYMLDFKRPWNGDI